MKSYDHLNCSRASIVQFRVSRYIMRLNRTTEFKVMTFWISRDFRFSILCNSIYYVPESDLYVKSYEHLNFSRASAVQFRASRYMTRLNRTSALNVLTIWIFSRANVVQFRASIYIMHLNRTSEWKVMTILISRELPLFNFERLDILCAWIWPPCEKLWPFEFLKNFRCSISSVSI